jgi:hypothetical protein
MKKLIGAAFAMLAFAVIAIPAQSARVREVPPKPGFQCQTGRAFEDAAWGSATLDAAGVIQNSNWSWRTHLVEGRFYLDISGSHGREARNLVSNWAIASLSWQFIPQRKGQPPKRFVQLTSSAEKSFVWGAFARSETERSHGPRVYVFWPDLLAFAKSASAINLNLFDDRGRFVSGQPIDREVFLKAEADIAAMLAALNDKVTGFQTECTKVDDIIDRDIVV